MGGNRRFVWITLSVLLAAGIYFWKSGRQEQGRPADVAPLRAALVRTAETALPNPTLTGVRLELRSAHPLKTATELVALASDLGGSAFALEAEEGRNVTANIPRAKAAQFAAGAGQEYRLAGEAEDMITFDVSIKLNHGAAER